MGNSFRHSGRDNAEVKAKKDRRLGVIFDSDGVVVDSEKASLEAFVEAVAEYGVNLSDEEVRESCGITDADIVQKINGKYGKTIDYDEFKRRKLELYRRKVEQEGIKNFPGVRELIALLRSRGIPYALASSGSRAKIEYNLLRTRLAEDFSVIVSCEDVKRGKPDPEIFLLAAERIGRRGEDCIVVEDSPNGIRAAAAAGMRCIAVTHTFQETELREAEFRVTNLFDAANIISKLCEGIL
jgi:HAD superfamily hydrolase (TIGR01509 family)